eukprot:TRINITY_DN306_c0_g1_i8.p1 TRINITY_DN306_c0_g1~~TRINITY_DN306_c0_g1_i8.p1  ORF type:complete len:409 (-),score=131.13 TRINITY_DN306_c0_g1_i8:766-1992(-)
MVGGACRTCLWLLALHTVLGAVGWHHSLSEQVGEALDMPGRIRKHVEADIKGDGERALEDEALSISQRSDELDDAATYDIAMDKIEKPSRHSTHEVAKLIARAERQEREGEERAAEDGHTEGLVEKLEAMAGTSPVSHPGAKILGSARGETLEALHLKAARAEEKAAHATAEAEEAHVDKIDADQRVDEAEDRKSAAEVRVDKARALHVAALKTAKKVRRQRIKADTAAQVATARAHVLAKMAEDKALRQNEAKLATIKAHAVLARAARKTLAKARLSADERLQKAKLRAHKTELDAQTDAVRAVSVSTVKLAEQQAAEELAASEVQSKAEVKDMMVTVNLKDKTEARKSDLELKELMSQMAMRPKLAPAKAKVAEVKAEASKQTELSPDLELDRLASKVQALTVRTS